MDALEACPIVAASGSDEGCAVLEGESRRPMRSWGSTQRAVSGALGGLLLLLLGTGLLAAWCKPASLTSSAALESGAKPITLAAADLTQTSAQLPMTAATAGSPQGSAQVPMAPAAAYAPQAGAYYPQAGAYYPQAGGQAPMAVQSSPASAQAGAPTLPAPAGTVAQYPQGAAQAPVAASVAYGAQAGMQAPMAAAAGASAQVPMAAGASGVYAPGGAQAPPAGSVGTSTQAGAQVQAAGGSSASTSGGAAAQGTGAAGAVKPAAPLDCSSADHVAPSWAPQPQASCTAFAKASTNCDKNCGNCFNPGARQGVMCKGQQTGYNCPSDPNPNGDVAFACMDWTFGSTAQKAAEASYNCRSGKDPVYFGVGTYGTSDDAMGGLGVCVLLDVEGMDRKIVAQSINTGFDVAGNQFDLQIGAGGAGAFNTCAGGAGSMYPGSKKVWGKQYGGLSYKANCSNLPPYPRDSAKMKENGDSLVELCEYGFDQGVRLEGGENPSILSIQRVACPAELVALTQLRRSDEPSGEEELGGRRLTASHKCGKGPGLGAAWCLTRMMDCRKPSGGFKDNIKIDHVVKGHRLVQPCTSDGYTRMDVQCGCSDCYC